MASSSDKQVARENRRPVKVTSFFAEGEHYDDWETENKSENRFFIVNLNYVMSQLGVNPGDMKTPLEQAKKAIEKTKWPEQYPSDYFCSHTQLKSKKRNSAKHFGRAVAIIVALELVARKKESKLNVYNWLRIIPAFYYVHRFNAKRLTALGEKYDGWSAEERREKFGKDAEDMSFEELCLARMEQETSDRLLDEIVSGHCLTKYAAGLLIEFVNSHFPKDLQIGPVLQSGSDSDLGRKSAAPSLRVPKKMGQEKLGPCS